MNKIIYYYQTFNGLDNIIDNPNTYVTDIIISSIHFGYNLEKPYIHLNNYNPNSQMFDKLWKQSLLLNKTKNIKIHLMVGGAGGAFTNLFNNFDVFYNLLKTTIKKYPFITGINLDIEEEVDLRNVIMLIQRIVNDFGKDFTISTAPIAFALAYDYPGMGGFCYKDIEDSPVGQYVDMGQFYDDFSFKHYQEAMLNKWPCEKIVMGMSSGQFDTKTINNACNEVTKIKLKWPNFGGVFNWEYFDSPPDENNPDKWAELMYSAIHN